jgi:hypothetical protein
MGKPTMTHRRSSTWTRSPPGSERALVPARGDDLVESPDPKLQRPVAARSLSANRILLLGGVLAFCASLGYALGALGHRSAETSCSNTSRKSNQAKPRHEVEFRWKKY